MPELAKRLLKIIRQQEFMRAGDRVAVAVSGGADSVALLLLLVELQRDLGVTLSVAHVNHKLRGAESDEDERFVAKLARELGLELAACAAPVEHGQGVGIESAARRLRYEFFQQLACQGCTTKAPATKIRVTKVATAHTLDDQAETVLLRMFRGTGIRGLAGILPRLQLKQGGVTCGEVVRPLLGFRRAELREYLRERGQDWREDSSNQDAAFLRNRLRRRLMPLIVEEFGDAAIERIAELAEIARAEEEQWPRHSAPPGAPLLVAELLALPLAAARRAVRGWIEQNAPNANISFRLIEEILELARGPAGRKLELPGAPPEQCGAAAEKATAAAEDIAAEGVTAPARTNESCFAPSRLWIARRRKELVVETSAVASESYEYRLPVPGRIFVPELGVCIAVEEVDVDSVAEKHRAELLDLERLGREVLVRNWRAGDRFWPAHTKGEKKVKELLSDRHVTGAEKKLWPVAVCRGELVWMHGFAVPKAWQARSGKAVWIREIAAADSTSGSRL